MWRGLSRDQRRYSWILSRDVGFLPIQMTRCVQKEDIGDMATRLDNGKREASSSGKGTTADQLMQSHP